MDFNTSDDWPDRVPVIEAELDLFASRRAAGLENPIL
jgi:hypothetical protein